MELEQQVQQIEIGMDDAREAVETADALKRLKNNKDFKLVFLDGFFSEEAIRLVELKAAPAARREDIAKAIDKTIDAIGETQQYLNRIFQEGDMAKSALNDGEAELNAISAEMGNG